ncbi:MAG: YicC/YloC family endoribonuclease [Polyangiaceae bacterium]
MTGFGLGAAPLAKGSVAVEVRAVNGRFLDVRARLPQELADLATMVESEARKRLARGRCDITVRSEGSVIAAPSFDKERARRAYLALVELRDEVCPAGEVPFSMLTAVPDLLRPEGAADLEPARKAVETALRAALDGLEAMRKNEGSAIAADLTARLATVRALTDEVAARAPEIVENMAKKFRERLGRIASVVGTVPGSGEHLRDITIDPQRVEQELVLLLERSDIAEELTRLGSHVDQMTAYMRDDEPLGRRLDFLLQEMAREINTIGAKSQDLRTSHAVVELKAEIERMREQVQNVE